MHSIIFHVIGVFSLCDAYLRMECVIYSIYIHMFLLYTEDGKFWGQVIDVRWIQKWGGSIYNAETIRVYILQKCEY